jgi:hypothetical protein
LKLDPGIYDIGSTMLTMKSWVDIEGSGQAITTIRGLGNNIGFLTGVVSGANSSELRNLRVTSLGSGFTNSIAVLLNNVNSSVRDVTLVSSFAAANWGLRNLGSNSNLQNLTITVAGGSEAYGIACTGASVITTPAIRRAVISVSAGTNNHGIYADQNAAPSVRDTEIRVIGGSNGYGIRYNYGADLTGMALEVTNSKIVVASGTVLSIGIEAASSGDAYNVTHTNISAVASAGGSGVGIRSLSPSAAHVFFVDHCDVGGNGNSVSAPFALARIGASRLGGPVNVGAPTCAASFTSTYAPLNAACL